MSDLWNSQDNEELKKIEFIENIDAIDKVMIITGASKGLGYSLAKASFSKETLVITVARQALIEFDNINQLNTKTIHFATDLSCTLSTRKLLQKLDVLIKKTNKIKNITLINNAGTVEPMGLLNQYLDENLFSQAFELNVVSAMRLCKWVLQREDILDRNKKIINISSGAGRKAVPGWGVYCATKAALDRFSEVIALERPDVFISSLAPGVIDTQMQADIRQVSEEQFPTLSRFTELHKSGHLSHPDTTARHIIDFLSNEGVGKTIIDDIRLHINSKND